MTNLHCWKNLITKFENLTHIKALIPQIVILFALLVLSIAGCTRGGGTYYSPHIAIPSKHISKAPFYEGYFDEENRIYIADSKREVNFADDLSINGDTYYYTRIFFFNQKKNILAIPLKHWISIINKDLNVIKKLKTPRPARDAIAIQLSHPEQSSYLAILIDQRGTSHSSTLYILDSAYNTVYKEHLLGAHWISKINKKNGDELLISIESSWRPHGVLQTIGGKWRYSVFSSQK